MLESTYQDVQREKKESALESGAQQKFIEEERNLDSGR